MINQENTGVFISQSPRLLSFLVLVFQPTLAVLPQPHLLVVESTLLLWSPTFDPEPHRCGSGHGCFPQCCHQWADLPPLAQLAWRWPGSLGHPGPLRLFGISKQRANTSKFKLQPRFVSMTKKSETYRVYEYHSIVHELQVLGQELVITIEFAKQSIDLA